MAKARAQITIQKPADEVWAKIGRFEDMFWHPGVETCTVEGDIRTTTTSGQPDIKIQQREYHRDNAARTYTYGFHHFSGNPIFKLPDGRTFNLLDQSGRHRATLTVVPENETSCVVLYDAEIEDGYDITLPSMHKGYQAALEHLKSEMES
jgi:hypothetical protein